MIPFQLILQGVIHAYDEMTPFHGYRFFRESFMPIMK